MINSEPDTLDSAAQDEAARRIVRAGSPGAIALAGMASLIVIAIWFAFYLLVFSPRVPGS